MFREQAAGERRRALAVPPEVAQLKDTMCSRCRTSRATTLICTRVSHRMSTRALCSWCADEQRRMTPAEAMADRRQRLRRHEQALL